MSEKIILKLDLYPKGYVEFGYPKSEGGMSVGLSGVQARIIIPRDCGLYPDGWFPLKTNKSLTKVKTEMLNSHIKDSDGIEKYFLPQSVLLDCYEFHWQKLYYLKSK